MSVGCEPYIFTVQLLYFRRYKGSMEILSQGSIYCGASIDVTLCRSGSLPNIAANRKTYELIH